MSITLSSNDMTSDNSAVERCGAYAPWGYAHMGLLVTALAYATAAPIPIRARPTSPTGRTLHESGARTQPPNPANRAQKQEHIV